MYEDNNRHRETMYNVEPLKLSRALVLRLASYSVGSRVYLLPLHVYPTCLFILYVQKHRS